MTVKTKTPLAQLEAEVRSKFPDFPPAITRGLAEQEQADRDALLSGGGPPPTRSQREGQANLEAAQREQLTLVKGLLSERKARNAAIETLSRVRVKPSELRDAVVATEAYAEAYTEWLAGGDELRSTLQRGEVRDLSSSVGSAGGYTVPLAFRQTLVRSMLNGSPLRGLATILETDDGQTMKWPVTDDTAQQAQIVGEDVVVSHTTDPTLTQATIGAYNWVAPAVLVPRGLIQDAGIDILGALGTIAGDRIVQGQNPSFITSADGLAANVTAGVTTASNSAITRAELLTALTSLRSAYRSPGTRWLMNPSTLQAIWGITDAAGHFVFDSDSGRLFGVPVVMDSDVAAIGASAVVAYVGRFDLGVVIRDVVPTLSMVLQERYADSLAAAVIVAQRTDMVVTDGQALRSVVMHS